MSLNSISNVFPYDLDSAMPYDDYSHLSVHNSSSTTKSI